MPVASAPAPHSSPLTPEAQAAALWTFIEAKTPRFSFDDALSVIRELEPRVGEDPKSLAKRLRKALQARRIALKHTHSLHAASQVQGHSSWHTNDEASAARLQFTSMETVGTDLPLRVVEATSWAELSNELLAWSDRLLGRGEVPLGAMAVHVTEHALNFSAPRPPHPENPRQEPEMWPLGNVTPLLDKAGWLDEAFPVLEKLRRHLEETGKAVLDGFAVVDLCAHSSSRANDPLRVPLADAANSELVLMREDDEDDPRSGYEVARGDELECWHQLELTLRGDDNEAPPAFEITVPQEGTGAWFVGGRRYVWVLETLKPKEFVPGRSNWFVGPRECDRLLRRYKLARRIHDGTFKFHQARKQLAYLGGAPETYRVNRHELLLQLQRAGMTWEGYCSEHAPEPFELADVLPVGFVFQLLQNLKVEAPNAVFARPTLAEMARLDDDKLLHALRPRVQAVRYVKPRWLDTDGQEKLQQVIDDFHAGLRMQLMAGGALRLDQELPHAVYVSDIDELRGTVDELGLVMYGAVIPYLESMDGLMPRTDLPEEQRPWPWAMGNALYLRFERAGEAQ